MRSPSTHLQQPVENQLSETVAWLLDRSDALARRFATCLVGDDDAAVAAIERAVAIGANSQVPLPPLPGTGSPRPDLAIVGSDRSFQVLVEVKVDASEHVYVIDGVPVAQTSVYIRSWRDATNPHTEAKVRKVATLTREVSTVYEPDRMRGATVTWAEFEAVLGEQIERGEMESSVAAVATDLREVLKARILGTVVDAAKLAELQSWGRPLVALTRDYLVTELQAAAPGNVVAGKWSVGGMMNVCPKPLEQAV